MNALPLALLLVLAGCASEPMSSCDLENPPESAQIRVTHGVDIATFPAAVPRGFTGCQRMWIGDHRDRRNMAPLATIHYEAGRVVRFAGQQPGDAPYDCRYVAGALDAQGSLNPGRCPLPSELETFE